MFLDRGEKAGTSGQNPHALGEHTNATQRDQNKSVEPRLYMPENVFSLVVHTALSRLFKKRYPSACKSLVIFSLKVCKT